MHPCPSDTAVQPTNVQLYASRVKFRSQCREEAAGLCLQPVCRQYLFIAKHPRVAPHTIAIGINSTLFGVLVKSRHCLKTEVRQLLHRGRKLRSLWLRVSDSKKVLHHERGIAQGIFRLFSADNCRKKGSVCLAHEGNGIIFVHSKAAPVRRRTILFA